MTPVAESGPATYRAIGSTRISLGPRVIERTRTSYSADALLAPVACVLVHLDDFMIWVGLREPLPDL